MTNPQPGQGLSGWTLWFAGLAFFTCYLGQTALGVIQPTISGELDLSASEAQWVVNSFFLTLALFAAPGGRLGDYYGHRQVLLVALGIFALGSLSAAVSQGFVWLVASIAVAGIGASTLYPSSAALIANRVPLERRGDALGKYSAIGVTVFVIGPLLAGLLTEAVSWRALFALECAVAAALVALGALRVDNRAVGEPAPFDSRGLALLLVGLGALLVALMQALAWGWDSAATISLLDVGLLRKRVLRGIVLAMFAAQFMLTGFFIYIATYFQHVLDYGPLLTSVAMAPAMLFAPIFNILAGRLTDRIGPRAPATVGYLVTALALAWITLFIDDDSYWLLLPALLVLTVSTPPMFTSLLTGLANAVGAEERGDANALVLTVRWVGAATGTMVLGVIIYSGAGADVTPSPDPYETAFTVLAAVTVAGAIACATMLGGRPAGERPRHHHFRPHF